MRTTWQRYCGAGCHVLLQAGQTGVDSFDAGVFDPQSLEGAHFVLRLAADDHYSTSLPYCLEISVNGSTATRVMLTDVPHGAPMGGSFTNFVDFVWPIPRDALPMIRPGTNTFDYTLGCVTDGWVVVEWAELRLFQDGCSH